MKNHYFTVWCQLCHRKTLCSDHPCRIWLSDLKSSVFLIHMVFHNSTLPMIIKWERYDLFLLENRWISHLQHCSNNSFRGHKVLSNHQWQVYSLHLHFKAPAVQVPKLSKDRTSIQQHKGKMNFVFSFNSQSCCVDCRMMQCKPMYSNVRHKFHCNENYYNSFSSLDPAVQLQNLLSMMQQSQSLADLLTIRQMVDDTILQICQGGNKK